MLDVDMLMTCRVSDIVDSVIANINYNETVQ